jgi:hypothetical protein
MEHRTAAKEWRMGWAFLPQKNASNTIIVILRGETVNANRGGELRILYRAFGHAPESEVQLCARFFKVKTLRALLSY